MRPTRRASLLVLALFALLAAGKPARAQTPAQRGAPPLVDASARGDVAAIRALLQQGATLDATDAEGNTPLLAAIHEGNARAALALVDAGASVDIANNRGVTPLHLALRPRTVETYWYWNRRPPPLRPPSAARRLVRELIRRSADPNARDDEGMTPLLNAVWSGNDVAITLLLERGARVDATRPDGRTALHLAADHDHVGAIQSLLDQGAALDATDAEGNTPLLAAISRRKARAALVLIDAGADVDIANGRRVTPLHEVLVPRTRDAHWYYAHVPPTLRPAAAARKLMRELIERSADPNARDDKGMTPLLNAAWAGNTDAVKLLLDRSARIDLGDLAGRTALHRAAAYDHVQTVRLLLDSGADLRARTAAGWEPLSTAISGGAARAALTLINAGADVSAATSYGVTPLHVALGPRGSGEHVSVVPPPPQLGSRSAARKVTGALLQRGADPNAQDDDGTTPLMNAALTDSRASMTLLLKYGARVDLRDQNGLTALHWAARVASAPAARVLLRHGAAVDARTSRPAQRLSRGSTPLHVAAVYSGPLTEVIEVLLRHGADTDATNDERLTPLALALRSINRSSTENVRLLLDHGAGVDDKMLARARANVESLRDVLERLRRGDEVFDTMLDAAGTAYWTAVYSRELESALDTLELLERQLHKQQEQDAETR